MKIKVGDRVKFLDDVGSGEVTRIVDQKTALVQIDGGFEVPCLIKELVPDNADYGMELSGDHDEISEEENAVFTEKIIPPASSSRETNRIPSGSKSSDGSKETKPTTTESLLEDEELVLALVPSEDGSVFRTYLINSSTYHLKYVVSRQVEGEMVLYHEDTIEAGLKIFLGRYQPASMSEDELFRVQGVFYNNGFYGPMQPLDIKIRIKADELFDGSLRVKNEYFNEKAIIHVLHEFRETSEKPEMKIDPEEIRKAMYTKGDVKPASKKVEITSKIEEVDLHIEKLVDDYKDLGNNEIMDIQVARFRTSLESALLHNIRRIVFIHGVGNGKLKLEIRRILDREYKDRVRYQDASFKEYGYGATMVIFK